MSPSGQLPLTFDHATALGPEDFMPSASNEEALSWLKRWPSWPGPALVLHGPAGAGKTHLATIWQRQVEATMLDRHHIASPLELDPGGRYLIDPAEPVADELGLLQLYNRLREANGRLLLTARRPVKSWTLALPDLASRLSAAPSIAINPPDDGLLAALFVKMFDDRQLKVPEPVIRYLITHMERSFGAARHLVDELDRLSLVGKRPITIPLARLALHQTVDED